MINTTETTGDAQKRRISGAMWGLQMFEEILGGIPETLE